MLVQIEIHPYLLDTLKPLLAYQEERGIASAAYGPLSTLFRYGGGPVDAVVSKLAKAKNVTEGNILLRWALQTGGGEIVTTSAKKDRLVEQLKTFEFELSEDEVKEIDQAGLAGKHQRTYVPIPSYNAGKDSGLTLLTLLRRLIVDGCSTWTPTSEGAHLDCIFIIPHLSTVFSLSSFACKGG